MRRAEVGRSEVVVEFSRGDCAEFVRSALSGEAETSRGLDMEDGTDLGVAAAADWLKRAA